MGETMYKAEIPKNHKEICTIYDIVSDDIAARKSARPAHLSIILGEEGMRHYSFMDALMHHLEYKGKGYLVNPIRRDKTPPQLHPLDAAAKPLYRYNDNESPVGPSGYYHTPRQNNALLIHETPEDFGQTPIGSLVVVDVLYQLFGEDTSKNGDHLTNDPELILDPIKDSILRLPKINHESVYDLLGRELNSYKEKTEDVIFKLIEEQYRRVLTALTSHASYIRQEANYMVDQDDLLGIINEMSSTVSGIVKNREFLEPSYVRKKVIGNYERIMDVMQWANKTGNYDEVDEEFLSTVDEHKKRFLLTLEKTLYGQIYIRDIVESVKRDLGFSPMIEKNGDYTDVVSKMDHTSLPNDTSIFRKSRMIMKGNIELFNALNLQQSDGDYLRLKRAADYLLRNLNSKIDNYLVYLQNEAKGETHYKPFLEAFERMQQKMGGFKEKVAAIVSLDDLLRKERTSP